MPVGDAALPVGWADFNKHTCVYNIYWPEPAHCICYLDPAALLAAHRSV